MKNILSEQVIRYKLYEAAIETGIGGDQFFDLISEAEKKGILGWIKSALGTLDSATQPDFIAGVKKMLSDKTNYNTYMKSTQSIQDSVKDLFNTAAKAGIDKDAVKDWLISGIEKMAATAASAASSGTGSAADQDAAAAAQPGQNVPVELPQDTSEPATDSPAGTQVVATTAALQGQNTEQAVQKSEKSFKDALKDLANEIQKVAGVEAQSVKKVIGYMFQNSLLEYKSKRKDVILERWQKIAGLRNLNESPEMLRFILGKVKRDEIKDILDLNKPEIITQMKKQKKGKLTDDEISQIIDELEKKNVIKPSEEAKAKEEIEKSLNAAAASPGSVAGTDDKNSKTLQAVVKSTGVSEDDVKKIFDALEKSNILTPVS